MIKEYEQITTEEYPEFAKKGRLVATLPLEYKRHVRQNAPNFKTYDKVRNFVMEQVNLSREETAKAEHLKPMNTKKTQDMETNMLEKVKQEALNAFWNQLPVPDNEEQKREGFYEPHGSRI